MIFKWLISISSICFGSIVYAQSFSLLTEQWEEGTDTAVIKVLGLHPKNNNLLYIKKTYKNSQWQSLFPEQTYPERYEFIETQSNKVRSFITVNNSEKLNFGEVAKIKETFIIPVIRYGNHLTLYSYAPLTGEVKAWIKVESKYDHISSVYALTNGFITIYSKGAYAYADFDSYDGKIHALLPIINKKKRARQILDIVEKNGQIFLIAKGEHNKNESALWLHTFVSGNAIKSGISTKFEGFTKQFLNAGFIPSLGHTPVLWISQREKALSLSKVSLVKLDTKMSVIWKKKMSTISQWTKTAAVSLCKGHFLISKEEKRSRLSDAIEFQSYNINPHQSVLNIEPDVISRSIITSFNFMPIKASLYSILSFRQRAKQRGPNGWYPWYGYSIKKLNIDRDCTKQ
jgi:hypothetical protein